MVEMITSSPEVVDSHKRPLVFFDCAQYSCEALKVVDCLNHPISENGNIVFSWN